MPSVETVGGYARIDNFIDKSVDDEILRTSYERNDFPFRPVSMPFFVRAELPKQKFELIDGIEKIIDDVGEETLRRHRETHPIM